MKTLVVCLVTWAVCSGAGYAMSRRAPENQDTSQPLSVDTNRPPVAAASPAQPAKPDLPDRPTLPGMNDPHLPATAPVPAELTPTGTNTGPILIRGTDILTNAPPNNTGTSTSPGPTR